MESNFPRILFLIIARDHYPNNLDEETQRQTWATKCNYFDVVWLKGNSDSIFFNANNRELRLPIKEAQENILYKTVKGIEFSLANFDFDILVRTNVSTYFKPKVIVKKINFLLDNKLMAAGYLEKTSQDYRNIPSGTIFITGTGIFLNKKAAELLTDMDCSLYSGIPDDVAISEFLAKSKVKIRNIGRCNTHLTGLYFPNGYARFKSSVDSERASIRMDSIYQIEQSRYRITKIRLILKFIHGELNFFKSNMLHRRAVIRSLLPLLILNIKKVVKRIALRRNYEI